MTTQTPLLRFALLADAAVSAASGVLLVGAAASLAPLLAMPHNLLLGAGLVCLGWAGFVFWLGRQHSPAPGLVRTAAILNAIWGLASLLAPALGLLAPNTLGLAVLLGQGLLVLGFAWAQWAGLRQARGPLAA